MRPARRLHAVWRARGIGGLLRFAATRLFMHRRDLLFESPSAQDRTGHASDAPERLVHVTAQNLEQALTPAARAALEQGEGADYVEAVRAGDELFAVLDADGRILHHSFVLYRTRTKALLGEAPDTPLFAHCVTAEAARGRRLYPRTLRHALRVLREHGRERAVINCDPANTASVKGIEHAGFTLLATLDTWIVAGVFALQRRRAADGRVRWRAYVG